MDKQPPLQTLEERIGYTFEDRALLQRAVTHRSFINETEEEHAIDNQRLEFLGDAALGLIIATELFFRYPNLTEGPLSATRAGLVNDCVLADVAKSISLGKYLRLGQGELNSGGREKSSILADAYEALVAAIYLDGGFEQARRIVLGLHESRIERAIPKKVAPMDFKSKLQRIVQQDQLRPPQYEIVSKEGPQHQPTFVVNVLVEGEVVATGCGSSKKSAQQMAAFNALKELNHQDALPQPLDSDS